MPRSDSINGDNTNIGGTAPTGNDGVSASLATIGSVAQVILVGETDDGWEYPEMYVGAADGTAFANAMFNAGHLGTTNYLFVDGHVKSMKPLATATPVNMWTIEDETTTPQAPTTLTDRVGARQLMLK